MTKGEEKKESKVVEQARCWILTIPATSVKDEEDLAERMKPWRWIGQLEKGEQSTEKNAQGYPHYQVGIINDVPIRFKTIQARFKGVHIKHELDREHAFNYCSKEKTRQKGPWRGGDWSDTQAIIGKGSKKGQRTDLESIRVAVMDNGLSLGEVLADPMLSKAAAHSLQWVRELVNTRDSKVYGTQRTQRHTIYQFGKSGTGKTTHVESFYGLENVYEVTDYKHPFDNYQGQPVIFLDEFDSKLDYQLLLKLMDDSPLLLPARYANQWAKHTLVQIASNKAPRDIYPWIDGEERIAFYRRLDGIMEDCVDGEESEIYEPRRYFEEEKRGESSAFGAFLGCYDPVHFKIDYEEFKKLGEDYPFPIEDLSRKIDYDSTVNLDLPHNHSEDEDFDFDVF